MSTNDYFDHWSPPDARRQHAETPYQQGSMNSPPSLPPLQYSTINVRTPPPESPISPPYDSTPLYHLSSHDSEAQYYRQRGGHDEPAGAYFGANRVTDHGRTKRQCSDEIPLRDNPQHKSERKPLPQEPVEMQEEGRVPTEHSRRRRRKHNEVPPKKSFWRNATWVVYIMTLIQSSVFIAELVRNSILTSTPIQIHPQFNPMIGPSFYVLVNMGARYQPCMKIIENVPVNIPWPCPNLTSVTPNEPGYHADCTLSEFCGFADFGENPNQWWRFIVPMFLHAGVIHLGFNMLLQLTLGREMEHVIGSIRFLIVYLSSGIFGFVLGGNFAANGIASTGASGALFGIIAINLLDLLYTWNERVSPKKELAFIILDIIISFVLGLLPGLDNFAHIGGFLMGLVLGVCLLHTPNLIRRERARERPLNVSDSPPNKKSSKARSKKVSYKSFARDPVGFFKDRKLMWWSWWLLRAAALIGVLVSFIVLLNNFYRDHNECSWCRYFTCIDVNNWCDQGNLTEQVRASNAASNNTNQARGLVRIDELDPPRFF